MFIIFALMILLTNNNLAEARPDFDHGDRPARCNLEGLRACVNRNQIGIQNLQNEINTFSKEQNSFLEENSILEKNKKLLLDQKLQLQNDLFFVEEEVDFQNKYTPTSNSRTSAIKTLINLEEDSENFESELIHYYLPDEINTFAWANNKKDSVLKIMEEKQKKINENTIFLQSCIAENEEKILSKLNYINELQLAINSKEHTKSEYAYMINEGCKNEFCPAN